MTSENWLAVGQRVQWWDEDQKGWVTAVIRAERTSDQGTLRITSATDPQASQTFDRYDKGGWSVWVKPNELRQPSPIRRP